MTTQLPLTDGCFVVDNSQLANIKMCMTYAKHTHIDKRIRAGASAKGRGAGKAWHLAMETLYRATLGKTVTPAALEAAHAALTAGMGGEDMCEGDDYLNLGRLREVLDQYVNGVTYELGKDGKNGRYVHTGHQQEPFDVLGVEVPFAVELGTVLIQDRGLTNCVPIIYTGRSDMVCRWHERGETTVLDHKTGRRWDASTLVQWQQAGGPKGYAHCIPQWVREGIDHLPPTVKAAMLPHEPVRQSLASVQRIDGFCLNSITITASTDLSRCKSPPTAFHRHLVYYQDAVLDEWREDALRWCQAWLTACAAGSWTLNDRHCHSVYGRPCPFLETCTVPPEQRALVLSTDLYEDNTWNTLVRTDEVTA